MNNRILILLLLGCSLMLIGCGAGDSGTSGKADADNSAAAANLDEGPRAAEGPVDAALVTEGEQLFQVKGCTACHAFGQKLSGPDLAGVASRRTNAWLETQILHPEVMAKNDPTARELIAKHALQMPNQGLTADEAKAVIEFLKSHETVTAAPQ
jgi:cytochrome c551/c552